MTSQTTSQTKAPEGFETRLLRELSEIDAARPILPQTRRPARSRRRSRVVVALGAGAVVALGGGVAAAAATGMFASAPAPVQHKFAELTVPGLSDASVDSTAAVEIGVIDGHTAYSAPTSNGGFCFYFADGPRSGPTGGSCIDRGAGSDEAVFSILLGGDSDILFGRTGAADAQQITASFPLSKDTVTATVVEDGFFAVKVPASADDSFEIVNLPDPGKAQPPTKDGGPIKSVDLDRVAATTLLATDSNGSRVASGIYVLEPDLAAQTTTGPLPSDTPTP